MSAHAPAEFMVSRLTEIPSDLQKGQEHADWGMFLHPSQIRRRRDTTSTGHGAQLLSKPRLTVQISSSMKHKRETADSPLCAGHLPYTVMHRQARRGRRVCSASGFDWIDGTINRP